MYLRAQAIVGMAVRDRDLRRIGKVYDLYFDDISFAVRYFVIESGGLFDKTRTLISPETINFISVERDEIGINLSAHEVRQSITVDEIPTLSRQRESEMARNFGWTPYWEYPMFPITNAWMRPEVVPDEEPEHPQSRWLAQAEPHLRSYQEVRGYRIQTADKRWGFLNDLMIRSLTWVVRFVEMEHYRYVPSRKVIVDVRWITDVNWEERAVHVDLPSHVVEIAPEAGTEEGLVSDEQLAEVIDYEEYLEARRARGRSGMQRMRSNQ